MVSLTPRARQALLEHARGSGAEGFGLKVHVVAGGCSGFSYDLHLVAGPAAGDATFGDAQLPVYVDANSLHFVDGTEIDYAGKGFRFSNPRARGVCSCGSSFAL